MKQSNLILGIGILVAVILIAGSFFLKAGPVEQQNTATSEHTQAKVGITVKNVAIRPLQELSKRIMDIL